jgi:hypothetical protein
MSDADRGPASGIFRHRPDPESRPTPARPIDPETCPTCGAHHPEWAEGSSEMAADADSDTLF